MNKAKIRWKSEITYLCVAEICFCLFSSPVNHHDQAHLSCDPLWGSWPTLGTTDLQNHCNSCAVTQNLCLMLHSTDIKKKSEIHMSHGSILSMNPHIQSHLKIEVSSTSVILVTWWQRWTRAAATEYTEPISSLFPAVWRFEQRVTMCSFHFMRKSVARNSLPG